MRIANALSAEQPAMTTTLLPGLLQAAARNAGRGQSDLALFETATVTQPRGSVPAPILPVDRRPTEGEWDDLQKALPDQPLHLGGASSAASASAPGWWGDGRPRHLERRDPGGARRRDRRRGRSSTVRSATRAPWHPGRCAEILVGEHTLGLRR